MKSKTIYRRMVALLLCILTLGTQCAYVFADENEDGPQKLTANFYSVTTDSNDSITVDFDPAWFEQSALVYDHNLAKLSIGLTLSAFRPNFGHLDGITSMDMNLSNFLTQAKFEDLRSDDYDKDPNIYSISTVMGHRKIGKGSGAFELIAVGVCGQGYLDEWESNFSIGTDRIHKGFDRSSSLVYDRIFGYIASNHIEGPMKIWISGFSRAAAVSSLTASRLSDSGVFNQETVFAYTFATPRYVKDPDYSRYYNIFNIVGKTDPVPMVPFAEWGYERYGQTFYLPSLETDSNYNELRDKANVIYKDLTGYDLWYNTGTTDILKTIFGYMLEMCPSESVYVQSLQDRIIRLWADRSPLNALSTLLSIANDPVLINENTKDAANGLLNYIVVLLSEFSNGNAQFRRWNPNASASINLAHFHTPELYIAWLFATDQVGELYNDLTKYSELYIVADRDIVLKRNGEVIERVPSIFRLTEKGEYEYIPVTEREISEDNKYFEYLDYAVYAVIPRDLEYSLSFSDGHQGSVQVLELDYTAGRQKPDRIVNYTYLVPEDVKYGMTFTGTKPPEDAEDILFERDLTTVIEPAGVTSSEDFDIKLYGNNFKVSDVMKMKKNWYENFYWGDAVMAFISVVLFIISIFLFQIVYVIGKIRFLRRVKKGWLKEDAKYKGLPALCVFAIFTLFLSMEFYARILPERTNIILNYKISIGILSILIALSGFRTNKTRVTVCTLIALAVMTAADALMTVNIKIGPFLHIAAYLILSYAYFREERPGRAQLALWILLSIGAAAGIISIQGDYGALRYVAIIYVAAAILMVVLSTAMERRVVIGSVLLFISGIMVIYNFVNGQTFLSHIVSLGTYYSAVAVMASSTRHRGRYRMVAELIEEEPEEAKQ